MKITLKDGSVIEAAENSTCLDVAKQISEGLAKKRRRGENRRKISGFIC